MLLLGATRLGKLDQIAMNEDALNLLLTRRTVPSAFLGGPGPSDEQVETLLTAAMRVPDHGKLAPWRYVALDAVALGIVASQLRAIRLAEEPDADLEKLDKQLDAFTKAPLCIVVVGKAREHPKIPVWEQQLSVGASTMNLMIATHAMGFSAQWLSGWMCESPAAKALLGVSDDETLAGFVHIGTPTVPTTERPRPSLADHLTRWTPETSRPGKI